MTSFLSAISGQFTRALILGALFPAALFVLLWLVFVAPLLPPGLTLPAPQLLGEEWGPLAIGFATILVAGLIYNLDVALIQFYEGYPWRKSLLGRWRSRVHTRRMREQQNRGDALFHVAKEGAAGFGRLEGVRTNVARTLNNEYPDRESLVLPTRLGNVLRAFERYPAVQYEIESIVFWPRLVDVMESGYAEAVDGARTSFLFLLTLSFLTSVLALATLLAGLVYLPPNPFIHLVLPVAGFAVAARWLYRLSLGRASAWGEMVKGAFDLYRWPLLEKMGFEQKPRTRAEERALWSRITQQVLYGDAQTGVRTREPWVDYADPPKPPAGPTSVRQTGTDHPALEVSRGVKRPLLGTSMRVVVRVTNLDAARTASGVVVTDALPAGLEYRWDSARLNGAPVHVSGINPYRFDLGDLPPNTAALLTYSAVRGPRPGRVNR